MWNPKLILLPVAAASLMAVQGMSQPAPQDPTPAPAPGDNGTQALAARVALLEGRIESLESYIEKQAKAADAMNSAIDEAVAAGFTAGINFKAREILVRGWKSANKAQMDVSEAKEPAARGARRR